MSPESGSHAADAYAARLAKGEKLTDREMLEYLSLREGILLSQYIGGDDSIADALNSIQQQKEELQEKMKNSDRSGDINGQQSIRDTRRPPH